MPTLLLDRNIPGTLLDNGVDFVRCVRCGIVKDIDVQAVGFDPNIMVKALGSAGMPQLGNAHPSIAGITVQRHIIRGLSNDQASVEIYYETPQHGAAISTVLITGSTELQTESAGVDGSGNALVISYTPSGGSVQNRHIPMNRLTPLRRIKVKVSQTSAPTVTQKACVGRVNELPWEGLTKGYWLCDGFAFESDNAVTTWTTEASFVTRVYRDWKEYAIWIDENGLTPEGLLVGQNLASIKTAMNAVYAYGSLASAQNPNGFKVVGFYPTADFGLIFGNP